MTTENSGPLAPFSIIEKQEYDWHRRYRMRGEEILGSTTVRAFCRLEHDGYVTGDMRITQVRYDLERVGLILDVEYVWDGFSGLEQSSELLTPDNLLVEYREDKLVETGFLVPKYESVDEAIAELLKDPAD